MEPVPVSRSLKFNQNQRTPAFDVIEPPSILRTHISLSKSTKRDASYAPSAQPNDPVLHTIQKSDEYPEINIFDAHEYFSGLHDQKASKSNTREQLDLSSVPRLPSVLSMDDCYVGRNYRTRWSNATPTASSEASWNSQTGLLSKPPGSAAASIKKLPGHGDRKNRTSRWFRLTICPCSGWKSVQVEETSSECKIRQKVQFRRTNSAGSPLYPSLINRPSSPILSASHAPAAKAIVSSSSSSPLNHDDRNWNIKPGPQSDHQRKFMNQIESPNLNRFSSSISLNTGQNQVVSVFRGSNGNTTASTTTNGFTFPILSCSSQLSKPMLNVIPTAIAGDADDDTDADNPSRDSLEVFQPREPRHSSSRERSCNLTYPMSPRSRRMSHEEEISSDASSDLFEIESCSTQTTSYPRRESMDGDNLSHSARRLMIATTEDGGEARRSVDEPMTPSVAATECYPPSEVSVVWSVTTAEGFDRASLTNFSVAATSDVDVGQGRCGSARDVAGAGAGEGRMRRGNGGLLSCRCEKAVSVGPDPVKCGVDTARTGPGLTSQNTRHVNGRAQPRTRRPPLGKSRSSMVTRPFAR